MKHTIEELHQILTSLGLVAGEDFTWSGNGTTAEVTLYASIPDEELPDVLKPFEPDWNEVERAQYKGYSGGKNTDNGTRFYLAYRDYTMAEFHAVPEVSALEETLSSVNSLPELEAYQAKRQEIWDKMFAERADLRELEEKLEKML